ncbi:tRNA (adenosine(37)-N6)-threonylcarbamoyltransferase complex dimerization subunit type 1 TsaB [Alteromonas pelagimontana]|uniref:tRNA threonylcarbamoyladenosine biosynthesis protein TsaB n=1 Tax=Alteromonas pelagimontana TaxID=1858656 RepID=A0A6M4MGV7_9ALTE|nr:tRNA (adenosine(37)-N6)-threonylcarbamoyltransferase complex dimerization subunit type 1 TsaB [Alteromonas pelagimontana]QJR82197.1 tRNA (adenosine(37)-N6)-threonylcarbamoyltransferase complex dimerization subunit type 1 TsaB [Alteromonas pelagimontana]
MNILAIDTATEACSVALLLENTVISRFEICPQQHSQKLLPMVDSVLKEAGVKLSQLDGLAFGRGPGSFTGVRIATGMIQGLALGSQLPVVGVSTLAAMAQQAVVQHQAETVFAAIDARMGEVYFGVFSSNDGVVDAHQSEQVCSPEAACELIDSDSYTAVGTGWQAYPALEEKMGARKVAALYPAAEYMLALAKVALIRGEGKTAEEALPVYLRDTVTWKKLPGKE